MSKALVLVSCAVGLAACAPGGPTPDLAPNAEESVDGLGAQSATVGSLTLSVNGAARFEDRNGQRALVIKGSANRGLSSVFSFVPDDAFGEATLVTARKFEIVLDEGHEINSVLSGMPLLLTVNAKTGATLEAYARISLAPAFARFTGSPKLMIEKNIRPVFVRNAEDNLRYRGRVSGSSAIDSLSVFTDDDSDPVVARVDGDTFQLDWQFPAFALAADPHTDAVYFSADLANGKTVQKEADVDVLTKSVELTTNDPYNVWPPDLCEEAVYWCVKGLDQIGEEDLGECGSYREVSRCAFGVQCLYEGPSSFALEPFDASDELDPAVESYNQACGTGGSWCDVNAVTAYNVPECLDQPATLEQAVEWLRQNDQDFVEGGTSLDRTGLEASSLFSSPTGAGLLLAIDVTTGGGEVQAYYASVEVPCHNCTDFVDYAVLFYPLTQTTVLVRAGHGYDS